ncbi:hypothetical protein [Membranihabitans maritimus]|uniref:hypothetical protein n=1 Tax=Membranihabitans maritimus TaxID=2904244 RepID=UPI001F4887CB|nr:hypothetical protein [Membranihabitans maritimus]
MRRRKVLNYVGLGAALPLSNISFRGSNMLPDRTIKVIDSLTGLAHQKLEDGDVIKTLGYYFPGDGGSALYSIQKEKKEIYHFEKAGGDLQAVLMDVKSVNYKMFGARGDAKSDDGPAILKAHQYANLNNIPIINHTGEYWIVKTRSIPVETNVIWGHTIFHIEEKYNTRNPVFHIKSANEDYISLSDPERKAIIEQIKPGVCKIKELAGYSNHLVHLMDEKDRIGFRAGPYDSIGRPREELFYVEEGGKIIGDIAWTFENTVDIYMYPLDPSFLKVEGGVFYLSGENPEDLEMTYVKSGITISRSRTIIKNQWVGLEEGKKDRSMFPQGGFYNYSKVYNVHLENVRLIPREKDREGEEFDVPHGTYGIGGNRVLRFFLKNVIAEGDWIHWGVMGTNMLKDVVVENCRLNRFDVHFHLWNLTIRDSHFGLKGISITGGGYLYVSNSIVESNSFVNFRYDYGAKWDGEIVILDSKLLAGNDQRVRILNFRGGDFEYGYPIGLSRRINIRNFIFDYTTAPDNKSKAYILETAQFEKMETVQKLFFPESMQLENIRISNRKQGICIMDLTNIEKYVVGSEGKYDHRTHYNSYIKIEDVDLDEENSVSMKFSEDFLPDQEYKKNRPHIQCSFKNIPLFSATLEGVRADLFFRNSTVNNLELGEKELWYGEVNFENCHIEPSKKTEQEVFFNIHSDHGVTFTNCRFHLPRIGENFTPALLNETGVFVINEKVNFHHIHSRLGKDILEFLRAEGVEVRDEFIKMLAMTF